MPIYEFACEDCGPFEAWRDHRQSGEAMSCPACGGAARRLFSAPGVRAPGNPFSSAAGAERARYERAQTGQPTIGQAPSSGRPLSVLGHGHGHGRHRPRGRRGPARPWMVGH